MNKSYLIKIYDPSGTSYIGTLNPKLVKNPIYIKSKINQGFGEVKLDVVMDFDSDLTTAGLIEYMNIYKIYEFDSVNHKDGILIYSGFVSAYMPYFKGGDQGITVTLLGMSSLMNFIYFKTGGGSYEVVYAATELKDIAEDIIDYFQSIYLGNLIFYNAGSIDITGNDVTYTFDEQKCLDALESVLSMTPDNWWCAIRPDGEFLLKEKYAMPEHMFTIGKDIESANVFLSSEDVINDVRVAFDGGNYDTDSPASQAIYGKRSKLISDQRIKIAGTAQARGDKEIAKNESFKREIELVVNNQYDLESIYVGQTCMIQNYNKDAALFDDNMQIAAIHYTGDFAVLQLDQPRDLISSLEKIL